MASAQQYSAHYENDGSTDVLPLWQFTTLRRHVGYLFLMHLLAGCAVQWLAWQPHRIAEGLVWSAGFFLAWTGAGVLIARANARESAIGRPSRAVTYMCLASALWSMPWLLAGWLFLPESAAGQFALACLLVALAAGATPVLAVSFPATAINVLSLLLPASLVAIHAHGRLDVPLGLCLLALLGLYLLMCRRATHVMLDNCRLRLLNERLVSQLSEQVQHQTMARDRSERALCLAEQACMNKTRFLAAASHDLRQPVHAISLFVAALKSEVFESRSRYLLDRLDRSLAGLDDLFNRLLDISRLDAGLIIPSIQVVDAFMIAQTLESRFMPLAASKSLDFRVHCKPGLQLRSDPELLIELLSNLLSNAFRYTERGGVLLAFRVRGDEVLIQVWDTGCGIPAHHIGLVFEEFVQLNNPARDRRKGLGLGLAIVKRLSEALDHHIDIRSDLGRGSTFGIRAERVACSSTAVHEAAHTGSDQSGLEGALVLVVDDEIDTLAAMEALLTSWGCLCILARSPWEAAKYVDTSLRFPDVIITDHRLADHSTSFDVAAAITPLVPYAIPIIVVSGESSPSLQREIQELGWSFMNKPVNPMRLRAVVAQALEKTLQRTSEAMGEAA